MQFKRKTLIVSGAFLILLFLFLLLKGTLLSGTDKPAANQVTNNFQSYVKINDATIFVELADTSDKKSKGLGGKTQLEDDYGMLFPFENQPYPPVFWMKGMEVPLDMIWINDNTIVQIDKNAQPEPGISDAQLKRYSPEQAVDYVLEVRGGLSDEEEFKVGDSVVVHLGGK